MFTVYFTNYGYAAPYEFTSIQEALDHARRCCFQAAIMAEGRVLATWCPIGGTRYPQH